MGRNIRRSTRSDSGTDEGSGRRAYLKATGAVLAAAGGAVTGVGGAATGGSDADTGVGDTAQSESEHTIEFDYDEYGAATDVYTIGRPEHAHLVEDDETALALSVPQNASWGTNATYDLPGNGHGEPTELYQSVQIRLDEGFAFREAGDNCRVLNAGLNTAWGDAGSGTNGPPSGTDGWSSRLYVRATGSKTGPFGLNVYTYHMGQQGGPGEEEPLDQPLFSPGEWHDVETYVRVNSVDGTQAVADGVARVWIDGTKVYDRGDFRWTTDPAQGHHRAGPVAYWGGPEQSPRDSSIYYRDHRIVLGSRPQN